MLEVGQRVRVKAEVKTAYYSDLGWRARWDVLGEVPKNRKERPTTWRLEEKRLYRRELSPSMEGMIIGRTTRYTGWREYIGAEEGYAFVKHKGYRVYLIGRGLQWRRPIEALEGDIEAVGEALETPEEAARPDSGGNGRVRYVLLFREGFAEMVEDLTAATDGPEELFANVFASGCVQVKVMADE